MRLRNGRREGLKPPLRLPLGRILAPERLALVAAGEADEVLRALRDGDRVHRLAVRRVHRFRERQHRVLVCTVWLAVRQM